MIRRRTMIHMGLALPALSQASSSPADVVVYGATPAGILAALGAAAAGRSVTLLEQSRHLGGMVTGGLGATDKGKPEAIGGLALEFFRRAGKVYGEPVAWWFEPNVALRIFGDWLHEAGLQPRFAAELADVRLSGGRIEALRTTDGRTFAGRMFIDASYEGDLMAKAKVPYTVGREGQDQYNEPLAGRLEFSTWDQFWTIVNPFSKDGRLLPLIHNGDSGKPGAADRKVQAYNFRLCLSNDKTNQRPLVAPPGYDPARYELLGRYLRNPGRALTLNNVLMLVAIPNHKVDVNNNGPVSTDYLGANWDYPEGSWARRNEIWLDHKHYTQGLLHYLAEASGVPTHLRDEMRTWGYAKDEFQDSGGFPPQLYVRECRRMLGQYVMRQADLLTDTRKPDAVGLGSYNIDSHHFQRVASPVGAVLNEGFLNQRGVPVYQLPYRCLVPKPGDCANLLVPVCLSASHVAYSSIRMEPQYMLLGHACGVAAAQAIRQKVAVQDVDLRELQSTLLAQGQLIHAG
ncbi:FAD-dependent oxidoreductase [uncultured Paludibaculum sp.]|uniref:FAD-dependent oxidoreductase n=1 Tax=uncultured Paludibaculum sp. TaxID=1765020 RepID=UPI002AABE0EB|nr:FAD-dependent oxidoreductase [uncultured Paludibaculum sp.]